MGPREAILAQYAHRRDQVDHQKDGGVNEHTRDTKKARALSLREFIFAMRPKFAHLPTTFSGQFSVLESI